MVAILARNLVRYARDMKCVENICGDLVRRIARDYRMLSLAIKDICKPQM